MIKSVSTGLGIMGLSILVGIFLFAQYVTHAYNLHFPPSLIGIAIIFILFICLKRVPKAVESAAQPLLKNMSLFFVPAIVGVLAFKDLLFNHAFAIFCAIFVSTILSLGITALFAQMCLREQDFDAADNPPVDAPKGSDGHNESR